MTLFDTFYFHRANAQLVLSYDFAARAFMGTMENTTEAALCRVRVEVHLSNGTKLDLTNPVDLEPGQTVAIALPARIQTFLLWTACPTSETADFTWSPDVCGKRSSELPAEVDGQVLTRA